MYQAKSGVISFWGRGGGELGSKHQSCPERPETHFGFGKFFRPHENFKILC